MPREFRAPCAGCSRKTPISKLYPVFHGSWPNSWWVDKRCESCGGKPGDDWWETKGQIASAGGEGAS